MRPYVRREQQWAAVYKGALEACDSELMMSACALRITGVKKHGLRAHPELPYKVAGYQLFPATDTGEMKEMALVTCLAAFASLASALADKEAPTGPANLDVRCNTQGTATPNDVKITEDNTTLTLTCPGSYTAEPAPKSGNPDEDQMVFSTVDCGTKVSLQECCRGATGQTVTNNSAMKLSFPTVPSSSANFYLKCAPPSNQREDNKACTVHVVVQSETQPGDNGSTNGGENQHPGPGQGGGPAGVQTCLHQNKTITVRVPEKGSSAQFACDSGSTLYPTKPDKIFSKNCKTEETLKDMTRTQTTGGTSVRDGTAVPTYTLEAAKKPAKKTLCYLCATAGTTPEALGTAENYCIIYVESGAAVTHLGLSFIVALALPCVPALFQFT